jgi:hypothetical protein
LKYITPADQFAQRRTVHPSQRQIHIEPVSAPLYVITSVFNPLRYQSRPKLFQGFEKHCEDSGAIPYTVELALRDRHHEVTSYTNPRHIQLRGRSELWYKENLHNVALRFIPADAEYIAFVDADFVFTRADWATETIHMLQHHPAVQMFSVLSYETHDHRVHNRLDGFAYRHVNGINGGRPGSYLHQGAVGGAWAFRRSALEKLGTSISGAPFLDRCILGSGDWHMAYGLAMRDDQHPEERFGMLPAYTKAIRSWREQAKALNGDIGYVEGHAIHFWHGPLAQRGYATRPQVLIRNEYNPETDLKYDENGVLQLTGHKPAFRDQIRQYFKSRNEDQLSIEVY